MSSNSTIERAHLARKERSVFPGQFIQPHLTQSMKHHAVDFRKRFGPKLPDAIVAVTALALEATLLINDQRLLALSDLPKQAL